ncbi:3-methyl-2-oxobutanoate hydroxymethyltransferase [Neoactinobaculum massilliense]|uniref:3-methyl-2-oxobutanoate hydroxymethyltransferase n=1 Tax=Neoactinobaculum massilliense TaxID=2364794 RepID=UPI000F523E4D|nr:3-methyl-2-oxobutanoate hydroxymethyltransferase [Neoactinobaculum massilliense]
MTGSSETPSLPGPEPVQRVRVQHLREMMKRGEKITALTASSTDTARIFDAAGVDLLYVSETLAASQLGYSTVLSLNLNHMVEATSAVTRGTTRAFIVADLPFGSYESSPTQAIASAVQLVRAGADAVAVSAATPTIRAITQAGMNVMARIGYVPQHDAVLGGPRVVGRREREAEALVDMAGEAEEAGVFAVLLDMVPAKLAGKITEILHVPTIGLGAGPHTDGQVLEWTDVAGISQQHPGYARAFGDVTGALRAAVDSYRSAVTEERFPGPEQSA